MSRFAERFNTLMNAHEDSLTGLGKKIGVSRQTLSNLSLGREPKLSMAILIADHYKVPLDWIVGRTEKQPLSLTKAYIKKQDKILKRIEKERLEGRI